MIKLLIRQIIKNWGYYLPLFLLWIAGGYLIFSDHHPLYEQLFIRIYSRPPTTTERLPNKHSLIRGLSRLFSDPPPPGESDPATAYHSYIVPAQGRLADAGFLCSLPGFLYRCSPEEITAASAKLNLMSKSCSALRPLTSSLDEIYAPHWLEQLREWNELPGNTAPDRGGYLVQPEDYWKENVARVLEALRDSVNALRYAYEIPPEIHHSGRAPLYVPELVEQLGAAVCREELGIFAWGDYSRSIEVEAYQQVEKSGEYLYPSESEILLLERLKHNPRYINALHHYVKGAIPDPFSHQGCSKLRFSLPCFSPQESLVIYNRLLYASESREYGPLYLTLGTLYLTLHNQQNDPGQRNLTRALDYLGGAALDRATSRDALALLIRSYLKEGEIDQAYSHLKRLDQVLTDSGLTDREFRTLARTVLMRLGRYEDADCYADLADAATGKRSHCSSMEL